MNLTRRRVAVATTSTLALLAALTGSAWASTSIVSGCTIADDHWAANDPGEVTLTYAGVEGKSMTVTPSQDRTAGSVSAASAGPVDFCDIKGDYSDVFTVRPGTSGLADGATATATATLVFDGDVSVTGSGTATPEAVVNASFSVASPYFGENGYDGRVTTDVDMRLARHTDGSHAWDTSVSHLNATEAADYVADQDGHGVSTTGLTVTEQVIEFPVVIGEQLDVDMTLNMYASVYGASTAVADVSTFQVELNGLGGIVLDRGDTPQPEPEPEPVPDTTALELLQQAREALAGYGLGKGITTSYDVKLRDAQDAIVAGEDPCGALESFQSHLEALRGKKLSEAQADELGGLIGQAQELLGC